MTAKRNYTLYDNGVKKGDYTADKIAEYTGCTRNTVLNASSQGGKLKKRYTITPAKEPERADKAIIKSLSVQKWAEEWDNLTRPYRKAKDA